MIIACQVVSRGRGGGLSGLLADLVALDDFGLMFLTSWCGDILCTLD